MKIVSARLCAWKDWDFKARIGLNERIIGRELTAYKEIILISSRDQSLPSVEAAASK